MATEAMKKLQTAMKLGCEGTNYYDQWADTYEEDILKLDYNPHNVMATEMALQYPPEARDIELLDCCAGTGMMGVEYVRLGFTKIDAIDSSEPMLRKAAERNIYRNIICDRLGSNKLNIESDRYDCVSGGGMFAEGHCKEDCLPELIRITKPGGRLVFTMCEYYIPEKVEFVSNLEPTMQRLHDEGRWKWITRKVSSMIYYQDHKAIVYVFEKL